MFTDHTPLEVLIDDDEDTKMSQDTYNKSDYEESGVSAGDYSFGYGESGDFSENDTSDLSSPVATDNIAITTTARPFSWP